MLCSSEVGDKHCLYGALYAGCQTLILPKSDSTSHSTVIKFSLGFIRFHVACRNPEKRGGKGGIHVD